jgi:hypothetical protein
MSPGNIRHCEPSSSSTMWLSECDRIFIANYGSTERSLLARRLGVRVVGIGFIGFVMADHAAGRSAQFSVTGHVAGNAADDSALDASFCIGPESDATEIAATQLVDVHYPDAACIRVVQDSLSTHSAGALYEAFAPAEARRVLKRLEFHYTPKHASWLNMVEIEIGVLRGQCLDRRIDDPMLRREIEAWERQRNAAGARIKWMFTTNKARAKMGRAYPLVAKES